MSFIDVRASDTFWETRDLLTISFVEQLVSSVERRVSFLEMLISSAELLVFSSVELLVSSMALLVSTAGLLVFSAELLVSSENWYTGVFPARRCNSSAWHLLGVHQHPSVLPFSSPTELRSVFFL